MFSVVENLDAGQLTVACRGALDYASAAELAPYLRALGTDAGPAGLVSVCFDLTEVSFVDSTGLADLLPALSRLLRQGVQVVVRAQPPLLEVLALFGVQERMHAGLRLETAPGEPAPQRL